MDGNFEDVLGSESAKGFGADWIGSEFEEGLVDMASLTISS